MIVDAHQHFWEYNPVRDAWLTDEMKMLRRDFMPDELEPIYRSHGVDCCVSVQTDQSEEETYFLLELAERYPFIQSVVGWVDLRSDDITERLERFSGFKKLAGFRYILQSEAPERMLEPPFLRGIAALAKFNFSYDILIYPRHLDASIQLTRKFPDQAFILDHLGKPEIKKSVFQSWATKIEELGRSGNVVCKLSGLVTEADWDRWEPQDLRPYLDHIFEVFGSKRIIFGSDWPVCLLAATYEQVFSVVNDYLLDLSDDEKADVLGNNAVSFYRIGS